MISTRCVRCGSESELLLNLVCCVSPRCQNFDTSYYSRWLEACGVFFNNTHIIDAGWKYLGRHRNPKYQTKFDLYHYGGQTFAVFGASSDEIVTGNLNGDPMGFYHMFWMGPDDVDAAGTDALKEAAARLLLKENK